MLSGEHVTKLYKTDTGIIHILVNANFSINPGDFVFITGFSGSGKSTFLKLLSGEESPLHGNIKFKDFPIHNLSKSAYLKFRQSIGVIYQDYRLIEYKNVFENISFVLEALNYSTKQITEITNEVLEIVGLTHRLKAYPHQLSGGEKRRVSIARAIAINPIILLADEPTGDLDPYNTNIIMEIMRKISERGTTIIMSTHHIELVQDYPTSRIWYLQQGQLYLDIPYDTLVGLYFNRTKNSNKASQKSRKNILIKRLKGKHNEKLAARIDKLPNIIIDNIEHLTPAILEQFYNLKDKELKEILKLIN